MNWQLDAVMAFERTKAQARELVVSAVDRYAGRTAAKVDRDTQELLAEREGQLEAVSAEHAPLIVERDGLKRELAVVTRDLAVVTENYEKLKEDWVARTGRYSPHVVERDKLKRELEQVTDAYEEAQERLLSSTDAAEKYDKLKLELVVAADKLVWLQDELDLFRERITPLLAKPTQVCDGKVTLQMTIQEWALIKQLRSAEQ